MINCRMIIDAAYSRSTFNDPGKIATDKELIGVIDRYMRRLYAEVARVNPIYFGTSAPVVGVAGLWARPAAAEVVTRAETSAGARVNITPWDDREGEVPPRIYLYGSGYKTVGKTDDPAPTDSITFFYAKKHPALDTSVAADAAANQLDATFPEQFSDLPVLRVSRYLAVKDGRAGEVEAMIGEEQEMMAILLTHLGNQDAGMVSRFRQHRMLVDSQASAFAQRG